MDTVDAVDAKKGSIYIIANLHRLGALKFAVYLEYTNYAPDTELYGKYNIFYIEYHGVPHYIIEIPASDIDKVYTLAASCNLTVVNGKPYGGADDFKLNCSGDACITLESIDLKEYSEDKYARLLRAEKKQIEDYIKTR